MLGIPHILVAINKMDLVDWSEEAYEDVVGEYSVFAEKLGVDDLTFIPISALLGDNVVDASENMPWYMGSTLLHHLEHPELFLQNQYREDARQRRIHLDILAKTRSALSGRTVGDKKGPF